MTNFSPSRRCFSHGLLPTHGWRRMARRVTSPPLPHLDSPYITIFSSKAALSLKRACMAAGMLPGTIAEVQGAHMLARWFVLSLGALLLTADAAAVERAIYRCTLAGVTTFSDRPCGDAIVVHSLDVPVIREPVTETAPV